MKTVLGLTALLLSLTSIQANEISTETIQELERKMLKTISADMKKILISTHCS